jgi:hypothetical protein
MITSGASSAFIIRHSCMKTWPILRGVTPNGLRLRYFKCTAFSPSNRASAVWRSLSVERISMNWLVTNDAGFRR